MKTQLLTTLGILTLMVCTQTGALSEEKANQEAQEQSFRIVSAGDYTTTFLLLDERSDPPKRYVAHLKGSIASGLTTGKVLSLDGGFQELESTEGKVKVIRTTLNDKKQVCLETDSGMLFTIVAMGSDKVGKVEITKK